MKEFKIETHLHTTYVSKCGWLGAEPILRDYAEAGYDAICITDHYNRTTFDYLGIDISRPGNCPAGPDIVHEFLLGYRRLRDAAEKYGIRVYEGAELRFDGSESDYLFYGFRHETLADPEAIISGGLEAFVSRYRREDPDAFLLQAHPFRPKCTPADPSLLDGVEVFNASPRHNSDNPSALAYAKKYGMIMTAGSDAHRPGDNGKAGILTDTLPADSKEFAALLRSGNFTIFHEE
ncbi:MAG: PHP domain-containing protein [Lachnospiraceae bacterium]|nr:PHP domain-containing protein [Lachnospiraceae bacterium]